MASKLLLCYAVTTFVILISVHMSDATGITAQLTTFLSNIINQKLTALNSVNMQISNNQATTRSPLVYIIISPNQAGTAAGAPTTTLNSTVVSPSGSGSGGAPQAAIQNTAASGVAAMGASPAAPTVPGNSLSPSPPAEQGASEEQSPEEGAPEEQSAEEGAPEEQAPEEGE